MTRGFSFKEIYYEDLLKDFPSTLKGVFDILGEPVSLSDMPLLPATKRQSLNISNEWKERFIDEYDGSLY
ncbi:hypothetical protein [Vreelandella aquamarina]|uniref:hypothetical protein n=1 Tax=Vreelandella aquamarina TaxID=77097 RepID=UPI00115FB642|nr:hypothetical protein [Halomonas aquamarina]